MDTKQTIFISELPHSERHLAVFNAFDSLALQDSFEIVVDHEPRGLIRQFQQFRGGQSAWKLIKQENGFIWFQISRILEAPENQPELAIEHHGCGCGNHHHHH
ncbi:DUF2249 domain-containing protein [bacterium]|nr:MAG: DUF2249 domain-containing protein [bacterium]